MDDETTLTLKINGQEHRICPNSRTTMLHALREQRQLTGTKRTAAIMSMSLERRNPQVVDDTRALFRRPLGPVEAAVAQSDFPAAGRFTVADISLGYAQVFAARLNKAALFTPAIQTYADRLQNRPAFQAIMSSDPTL